MVFNATFKNISAISWCSVLFVEETGVPGENHRPVASRWQTFSHNVESSTLRLCGIQTLNVSYKFNYHTITTTTAPYKLLKYILIFVVLFKNWMQFFDVLLVCKSFNQKYIYKVSSQKIAFNN